MVAKSIAKIYTNIHKPTDYTVGKMKIGLSEKILLLLHPHVDFSYSLVVT